MKLQQLRYINEIKKNGYNISLTSHQLYTSQPGISKQVSLLEDELGVKIFDRQGKHLSGPTNVGKEILNEAIKILEIEDRIKAISSEVTSPKKGKLNIFTTNAIANFILPKSVRYLLTSYPNVSLHMSTIEPSHLNNSLPAGPGDIAIVAQDIEEMTGLTVLPAYKWSLSLIIPSEHPLSKTHTLTLEQIAKEKLISYELKSTGRIAIDNTFSQLGLTPDYIVTAMDVEVIKEYVSKGVGIGIIASVAAHSIDDSFTVRSLEGFFPDCYAWLCFGKNVYLQTYMYDFIEKLSPHLTKVVIEQTKHMTKSELIDWFKTVPLHTYK